MNYCTFYPLSSALPPLPPKEEAKLHVILNVVKNPTEELTSIYFITLVVGYFAYAQYDVCFFTVIVIKPITIYFFNFFIFF